MHLRPIRGSDVEIDYPAVMGSRELLWEKYGEAWGWPPATMALEGDREDLEHHEREIAEHKSFNYAVLDADETRLLGCIYLDPPRADDEHDVIVSWWVVEDQIGSALDAELTDFVPRWVTTEWPFSRPHYGV
jgi:RimJ/RimL family protein N-acetyltransferase